MAPKKTAAEKMADRVEKVKKFMSKLQVAAQMDADLNRVGKPAIHKLELLPKLRTALHNEKFQSVFIKQGVFTTFQTWLEFLPDNSLPNQEVRKKLLELLNDIPIFNVDMQELKNSSLAKTVLFLTRLAEETLENRRLATMLVEKWSRQIFNIEDDFKNLKKLQAQQPSQEPTPVNCTIVDDEDGPEMVQGPAKKTKPSNGRVYVEVPLPSAVNCLKHPESKEITPKAKEKSKHGRIRLKLKWMKDKNKKSSRLI